MDRLHRIPVALLITLGFALSFLVPAIAGFATGHSATGRIFLYASILGSGLSVAVILAVSNQRFEDSRRNLLLTLLFVFTVLPMGLAIPVMEALRTTTFVNAYLDMVSAITTTALPTYEMDRMTQPLIIWRSLVAWLGALIMWVFAWTILMPLRLGGYEILAKENQDRVAVVAQVGTHVGLTRRFLTELATFGPLYLSLTMLCWFGLTSSGLTPYQAMIFAMGATSTAGYLPTDAADLGFGQEILIFATLFFAVSRQCYGQRFGVMRGVRLFENSELRLAVMLVVGVAVILFARQFVGAATVDTSRHIGEAAQALWGGLFTALSFLTTTGYTSFGWDEAQSWSGLSNPAIILMALSLIGGGVATTAGGIKLLRMSSLMHHSSREIMQLAEPKRIIPNYGGGFGGKIQNAVWAWVFLMSFFMVLCLTLLGLALNGADFETALVTGTAALTNSGPLMSVGVENGVDALRLGLFSKLTIILAMVLGRVETLAVIALMNPDIWRR